MKRRTLWAIAEAILGMLLAAACMYTLIWPYVNAWVREWWND